MSLLFMDGVDHYATADITRKWDSHSGFTVASTGRFGTGGLRIVSLLNRFLSKGFPSQTDAIIGFFFRMDAVGGAANVYDLISIRNGASVHAALNIVASTGLVSAETGGTSRGAVTTLGFMQDHYIEVKLTAIDGSTGTFTVRVNGVQVFSFTGDTQSGATTTWDTLRLCNTGAIGVAVDSTWDDFYVLNSSGARLNDFLGPRRIVTRFPEADGTHLDFTPSTGMTHYTLVDDPTPNDDTDYVSSSTPGHKDTYQYPAIGLTGAVDAVQVNALVRSDGAGSETTRAVARVGGTDYVSAAQGMGTSYAYQRHLFPESPDTTDPWTISEIDATEFGLELVS